MASQFIDEVNRLRATWLSYMEAGKQARASQNSEGSWIGNWNKSTPNTMVDTSKFTESTWMYSRQNAQNAVTSTYAQAPTQNVNGTNLSIPNPVIITWQTDTSSTTQWNKSTITWGTFWSPWANGKWTSQQVVEGQTNKVITDSVNTYDYNARVDKEQLDNQKATEEIRALETDTELKRKEAETKALAEEEDRIQREKATADAANLSALQEKERYANEASVAAAQAKADAAERELQIANDIELQKSNVAFAKMGLTMSTAAVTSAQQIYTTWVYNLSKLKSENAFKMANLQVDVAKVEFDHTKVINDIINKSSDKSYEIRKKLNDDIHTIKNSIIDNRFERQKNIDKAIDTYQEAISKNEDEVLDKMNKANKTLQDNVDTFYGNLKKKEEYNTSKISTLVSSGKWYAMSPIARSQYEKGAGLPTWTVARQVQSAIGTKIYTQAQQLTGLKWVTFSSADYNAMLTEAQRLAELGVPLDTAINQVVTQYLDKSPEYQAALAKARKAGQPSGKWGSGGSTSSKFVSYQTLMWPDNKPHRYGITADRQTVDLGISYTSIPWSTTADDGSDGW